jgi:DNA-binding transcriptional MerR regulator
MSAEMRIGEVAKLAGTTPRTIRYYEEIGLLPAAGGRERGAHRLYAEADVERLTELLRLKDLLGLSLEELKELVEAEGSISSAAVARRSPSSKASYFSVDGESKPFCARQEGADTPPKKLKRAARRAF